MSIATVVTRGFGSFSSVNLLPTLGYSISTVVIVYGPYCAVSQMIVSSRAATSQISATDIAASALVQPAVESRQTTCGCD